MHEETVFDFSPAKEIRASNHSIGKKRHSKRQLIEGRNRHINKKLRILKNAYRYSSEALKKFPVGKLSKGKIHCGCYMCKPYKYDKTKTASDIRKHSSLDQKEKEYLEV